MSAGANVKLVQCMLGHKSAAVRLEIYSDLFEQDIDKVAADLSTARGRSRTCRVGMWAKRGHERKKPGGFRSELVQ